MTANAELTLLESKYKKNAGPLAKIYSYLKYLVENEDKMIVIYVTKRITKINRIFFLSLLTFYEGNLLSESICLVGSISISK